MEQNNTFYEDFEKRLNSLSENDVAVFDEIGDPPENLNIQTEVYFLLFCTHGRASCRIGEKTHEVHPCDLFLCSPKMLVESVMISPDFKCQGTVVSSDYLESILLVGGRVWDAKFVIKQNPVIHLSEDEMEWAIVNNNFLRKKLEAHHMPHQKEMLRALLQAFVFEFYDMIFPKLNLSNYAYTSAENLFSRFMTLAENETPRQREVKYYADRLCVSPKYLSSVCKQQSGNTASAILSRFTTEHIKHELRSTSKSIKEIAAAAGFDNLSFFGKFVRRELGVSPREYRLQNLNGK